MNTRIAPHLLSYPDDTYFTSQADAEGAKLPPSITTVRIGQRHYKRAASEPGHDLKFRSSDRFKLGGGSTVDPAHGGWWGQCNIDFVSFDTRAAAEAANVDADISFIWVIADGLVMLYSRDPAGTALETADGSSWSPVDTGIYPECWADNTTPGTTDMATAIQAAEDYRASVSGVLRFPAELYRCNSQLRVRTGGAEWKSSASTYLYFYTSAGTDCILIGPDNATTPATAYISDIQFDGILAIRMQDGSTSAVWRAQKVGGLRFRRCSGQGGKYNWLMEGARNVYWDRQCSYYANSFTGASGSAGVKITALDLTDETKLSGYTVTWEGYTSDGAEYDDSILLESIDYFYYSSYSAGAGAKININPTHADHHVYNVEVVPGSYADGPTPETGRIGITIDGAGSGASIDLINLHGPILAQQDRGLWIKAGSPVKRVNLTGVDIHNTLREAVYAEACSDLRLSIIGGSILEWNYSGTATGDEEHAIRALGGKTLQVIGVSFDANGTAMPAIKAAGFDDVVIEANVGTDITSTPVTYSGNTRVTIKNNSGNTVWPDVVSEKTVSHTPTISFAGGSTGITYGQQSWRGTLGENDFLDFSVYVLLSNKGSSTGEFRINLPYTAAAGPARVFSVALDAITDPANTIDYRAVLVGGTSYLVVTAKLSTGSAVNLTDANLSNASYFTVSGRYRRA